ncbi:MAG TPA: HipA N-terminal domain-containing protein [Pirellulales bacterium]|nr:HipA N-terminal domain-containing protein [Pirellulales bacterium]
MRLLKSWMGKDEKLRAPPDARADFQLRFKGMTIGILSAADGEWTFRYTDDFRRSGELRPIVEFPDVDKVYKSDELWPFFVMRLPSLKQPSVRDIVKSEAIDDSDEVELLRRFGKRTIASPFELVAD